MNRILLFLTACIASLALLGKATHAPILAGWVSGTIYMKDTTAWMIISQVFACLVLSHATDRKNIAEAVWFVVITNFLLGLELLREIAYQEHWVHDPSTSFFPSTMAVVAMLLLSTRAVFVLYSTRKCIIHTISTLVGLIGFSTVIGYLFNVPALYFYLPNWSTSIAVPTGICLILLAATDGKVSAPAQ